MFDIKLSVQGMFLLSSCLKQWFSVPLGEQSQRPNQHYGFWNTRTVYWICLFGCVISDLLSTENQTYASYIHFNTQFPALWHMRTVVAPPPPPQLYHCQMAWGLRVECIFDAVLWEFKWKIKAEPTWTTGYTSSYLLPTVCGLWNNVSGFMMWHYSFCALRYISIINAKSFHLQNIYNDTVLSTTYYIFWQLRLFRE